MFLCYLIYTIVGVITQALENCKRITTKQHLWCVCRTSTLCFSMFVWHLGYDLTFFVSEPCVDTTSGVCFFGTTYLVILVLHFWVFLKRSNQESQATGLHISITRKVLIREPAVHEFWCSFLKCLGWELLLFLILIPGKMFLLWQNLSPPDFFQTVLCHPHFKFLSCSRSPL